MKIKPILKYQLRDYRNTVLIMYLCVYLFVAFVAISNFKVNALTLRGEVVHNGIGGVELASFITLFVIALNSFKLFFKFFSVNGISRKTLFCSVATGMGITAAALALIDTFNTWLFSRFTGYESMFMMIYQERFGEAAAQTGSQAMQVTFPMLAQQFLWLVFAYLWVVMVGFFITNLYYRMNKSTKIAVSIGVPVSLFYVLPFLDQYLWNGVLSRAVMSFANFAWGLSNGYNSYIGMVSMFVFAAVTATLTWLLVRRANVKV